MGTEEALSQAALPDPELVRQTAREVLSRPDYRLDIPSQGILDEYLRAFWEAVINGILKIIRAFMDFFQALSAIHPVLAWGLTILLFAVLVALIIHIVITFRIALRRRAHKLKTVDAQTRGEAPETWEGKADTAGKERDYITALRCLFISALLRMEKASNRRFHRAATNREYLFRFRNTPAFDPLHYFVNTLDWKWYGGGVCTESDYEEARRAHARLRAIAEDISRHAQLA
ncbi:MAG: hypothetical protein V1918_04280 [Planctomycetota bacterium]